MGNPLYLGVFLTAEARQHLLSCFPPTYPEVHADHMTIIFKPDELSVQNSPIGKKVRLRVLGHAQNDRVQAIAVEGVLSKNNHAHITVSVDKAKGGKPVDSNRMLDQAFSENTLTVPAEHQYLEGVIDVFPRSTTIFTEILKWLKNAKQSFLSRPALTPTSSTPPKA